MNCKDATQRLSEALDRDLSASERLTLQAHLLMCTGCTQYKKQLAVLRLAARRLARGEVPDPQAPDENQPPADGV